MKFQLISDRRPIPSMTSVMVEPTARHRKARCQNGVLMIRQRVWKVGGVILLVFGLQLLCGLQVYAEQPDLGAVAAPKAAAGREALLSHGASRASDSVGTLTPFDAPGAGAGPYQGTWSLAINPWGTTTGFYFDGASVAHGFLRAPNGRLSPFDAPGAGTGSTQGTFSLAINLWGTITGYYYDSNFVAHGFLRAPNGRLSPFDAPGAAAPGAVGTVPSQHQP